MVRFAASSVLALALTALVPVATAAKPKPPATPLPLTDALPVSGCSDCETWPPQLFPAAAGEALVGWRLLHDDNRIAVDRFGVDGPIGTVATLAADSYLQLAGAAADGEDWMAVWFANNRILFRRFVASGPMTGEVLINPDRPAEAHDTTVSLATGAERVVLTWARVFDQQGVNQLVAQVHDPAGRRLTGPVVVGEGYGFLPSRACVRADGSAVVVWSYFAEPPLPFGPTPAGLAVRIVGADGEPLRPATSVVTPGSVPATASPPPSIACAADGSFALIWNATTSPARSGLDIVWQRFDAAGKARGKPQLVNSGLAGDQVQPRLLQRRDGSFIATWVSRKAGVFTIEGRRIAANGRPQGKDFVLYTASTGSDFGLHTTTMSAEGGSFVLSWWEGRRGLLRWFSE